MLYEKGQRYLSLCMRKPTICIGENKDADQLRGNREADHAFVFATRIVQFLFFLNPKFQASSLLLSLYSPVCVGPGRKSRKPVFSRRGSFIIVQANMERVKRTSNAIFRDTRHGQRTALKKQKHVSNYPSCQIVLRELFRI